MRRNRISEIFIRNRLDLADEPLGLNGKLIKLVTFFGLRCSYLNHLLQHF
jgi:hypothetical protein